MRKIKMKRTTKQYITVALISIIVIGAAAITTTFFITRQIKSEYEAVLTAKVSEMEQNKRTVYIAKTDIATGQIINEDNLSLEQVYSSQPQDTYITKEDIGKMTLVSLPQGTQIIRTMLTENTITGEVRELQYEVIMINTNIVSEDAVDIRIQFPNGESLVVLSKKVIKGVAEGSVTCYLWLDAEEILRMSAAIVDAALYPGTQLITSKYIEPAIQEASEVTYTPSLAILDLLERDPNILVKSSQELNKEVRKALENRLASSMATDVTQVNWDINPNTKSAVPTNEDKELSSKESTGTDELGSVTDGLENSDSVTADYFYYAEEEDAKDGEMEYGE